MAKVLNEKGAVLNKTNKSLISTALEALKSILAIMPSEDEEISEAGTWSVSDQVSAISKKLQTEKQRAYLQDVYPDEMLVVYQEGWYPSKYYQCSYTLDDTGVATFGDPIEVNRKVTYVPTSDNNTDPVISTDPYESAKEVELTSDSIQLVERAVNNDGITMLKLISPGMGSSGYYPEEVLKRDGPKVFKKGTHNLIDHPTPQEESARPEGSIERLGSTLIEDATWKDDYNGHGPGLYAKARVSPDFAPKLNTIASDIGMSIRASGKASMQVINGAKVPVIESIDTAKSVDYVTIPGRGGKVLELMESAKAITSEGLTNMAETEEIKQLRESNAALATQVARLQEGQAQTRAVSVVADELRQYPTLPRVTRQRLSESLPARYRLDDNGMLDVAALKEAIKNAVTEEMSYLASLGMGHVADLGASGSGAKPLNEAATIEALEKEIDANLA